MATKIDFPILSVNPCKMSHVDSNDVGNLASVWGVFHKCSRSLEDGRRLENMSWRMLNRHTVYQSPPSHSANETRPSKSPTRRHTKPSGQPRPPPSSLQPPPAPSSSTTTDDTAAPSLELSAADARSPEMSTSVASNKTVTVVSFERMVSSIQEQRPLEPLSPTITAAVPAIRSTTTSSSTSSSSSPSSSSQAPPPLFTTAPHRSSDSSASTAPPSGYESERSLRPSVGSDTSAELMSCHSVVRGFSPSQASSSYRSSRHLTPAVGPSKSVARIKPESVKKGGGFMLGGSSGEDESSFEERMQPQSKQSSLSAGLKRPTGGTIKKLSFQELVEARRHGDKSHDNEDVFESDDDDDDESAIEEDSEEEVAGDDDEAWEDDHSENADHGDRPLFARVDSNANLISRRSLLTSLMNQEDRANAFQDMATKSSAAAGLKRSKTSGNVADATSSMAPGDSNPSLTPINVTGTPAKPIMRTKSDLFSLVSSPRTTRRNMLSTEIDENLRKSILHERMQKKSTLNAYNKRVQSARNLPTLPIHSEERDDSSSRDDFDYCGQGIPAYNETGW